MSINNCKIIELPSIVDERGGLAFVENNQCIPFAIQRVYYLYNTNHLSRGGHAHKNLKQLMIAISGSFELVLDDGKQKKSFLLDDPTKGALVYPGLWRDIKNFSECAVCLVLASMPYSEEDYIRSYDEFKQYVLCEEV